MFVSTHVCHIESLPQILKSRSPKPPPQAAADYRAGRVAPNFEPLLAALSRIAGQGLAGKAAVGQNGQLGQLFVVSC